MIDLKDQAVKVKEKAYKVSSRNGYNQITMPKDIEKGSLFVMWRFPDGVIVLIPEKK